MPGWCGNIVKQLGKTILKPVLRLRPNGKVDWRNFGRMPSLSCTSLPRGREFLKFME
jgi:hypothetical protein